jgi:hypothetical protein
MGQRSKRTWAGTKIELRKSGVSEGARAASFGRELLGECYEREPLTREEIEALGLEDVTEKGDTVRADAAQDLPLREPRLCQRLRRKRKGDDGLADRPPLPETRLAR